ncbi:MAG: hypothetical protein QOC81_4713 [Thermoanaerobaculia bacterium]|jgi:hypothetical protein|nr:hypothetical protein [Thermoanaerobaculia bacterium]
MRRTIIAAILVLTAAAATAQVVTTRSSAVQLLIPAAGALDGGGGTFFRSDITILNYRSTAQRIRLQWLPQTVTGIGVATVEMTINAQSGFVSEDFVTNVMLRSGLGSIIVTGITAAGDVDPSAQLVATSRIWTPQPASGGTTSQSLPSLSTTDINSSSLTIVSERRDSRYRLNVGIVNMANVAQRYQVVASGSGGNDTQQVDVEALSMKLFNIAGANSSTPVQVQVTNITATSRSTAWTAFGSSVDNITGDAWTTIGFTAPGGTP